MRTRALAIILALAVLAAGTASANTVTISAVASLTGRAHFQSDVRVFNRSFDTPVHVTATYYCSTSPCGNSPQTFDLTPRQSMAFDDIAAGLFNAPGTQGAVTFQTDADELVATSRLYSVATSGDIAGGSLGQFVPGLEDEDAYPLSILTSLRNSTDSHSGFRSNITAFNTSGSATAHVTFSLSSGGGASLGTFSTTIAPHGFQPAFSIFGVTGASATNTENAYCAVSSDQPVFVAASILDNISQDTIFVTGSQDDQGPTQTFPKAGYDYSPANPSAGQQVNFTDTSTGAPTSWSWDFGDQSPADTSQNPTHTFAQAGNYFVTLTATNAGGPAEHTEQVTVAPAAPAPNAVTLNDTYYSPAAITVNPGDTVTWTNQGDYTDHTVTDTGGAFDSGFIFTGKGVKFTHTFTAADAGKTFHYQCQSHGVCCGMKGTITVNVTGVPAASFTFAPPHPAAGGTVTCTDASSGLPTSWSWNFGDPGSGASNTSTSQNPSHMFASAGPYTVSLTASNSFGPSVTATMPVTVDPSGASPTADFTFSPLQPNSGRNTTFTDSSTGNPTSWSWDFGDPTSIGNDHSTVESPVHVFQYAGTYSVALTATNPNGHNTKTVSVKVTDPPPPPPPPY